MSGYAMGLADNMMLSLSFIIISGLTGIYALYRGLEDKHVLLIIFGGIGIGFGFIQWLFGYSMAVLGACFGIVGTLLSIRNEKKG